MLSLKQKYRIKSLEPLGLMDMWRMYPDILISGYTQMHQFRNILSQVGINFIILTYACLVALLIAQEVLVGDSLWRQHLLTLLLTHVIFDLLVNVEPFYIVQSNETKDYTAKIIFGCDRITFADRILQLRRDGFDKEADSVSRTAKAQANSSDPMQSVQWIAGFEIRHKATGRQWRVYTSEGDDYVSYVKALRAKSTRGIANYMAIFQEMDDRRLSLKHREIVLKRLQRHCFRIEGDDVMSLSQGSGQSN